MIRLPYFSVYKLAELDAQTLIDAIRACMRFERRERGAQYHVPPRKHICLLEATSKPWMDGYRKICISALIRGYEYAIELVYRCDTTNEAEFVTMIECKREV